MVLQEILPDKALH